MNAGASPVAQESGLTPSQVASFEENGFIGPFPLYTPEEAAGLWRQAVIEMALSRKKPHNSKIINYDRHLDCKTLSEHISHPRIVAKLRSLIGHDILCWKTNVFPKQPGESGTGWHQVETYAAGQAGRTPVPALEYTDKSRFIAGEVSVWTAFTPARREHGCLRFIPGSHKKWYYDELRPLRNQVESRRDDFFGYDYSELQLDKDWEPDREDWVAMEMGAGEFVIFLEKCIHGSLPNTTRDQARLAFASRYLPTSVKVYSNIDHLEEFGERISLDYFGCVLVSGRDEYGFNRLHTRNLNGFPFRTHG